MLAITFILFVFTMAATSGIQPILGLLTLISLGATIANAKMSAR